MKTIFTFLTWLLITVMIPIRWLNGSNRENKARSQLTQSILKYHVAWLHDTIGDQNFYQERKMLVQSMIRADKKLWMWNSKMPQKVSENLNSLLKKEESDEMLEYLVCLVGKIGLREVKSTILAIFYKNTENSSLCKVVIEALKSIGLPRVEELVVHAIQYCSFSVCREALKLSLDLSSEEKTLDELFQKLIYYYATLSLSTKLRFIDSIFYIRNRWFIRYSKWKREQFTIKSIKGFSSILEYAKEPMMVSRCTDLLLLDCPPKFYKILTEKVKHDKIVSSSARSSIIKWLVECPVKKEIKNILLEDLKSKDIKVRINAIRGLKNYLTLEMTTILLRQLKQSMDIKLESKELIRVLGNALLLRDRKSHLFYDSSLLAKKHKKIRNSMIDIFRTFLNQTDSFYIFNNKFRCMAPEIRNVITYLAYLKDKSINDHLWDMLQSQKKRSVYLHEKVLRTNYLRLYQQAPIFLLSCSSLQKVVVLYILSLSICFTKLFPSDLFSIVFSYLAIFTKNRFIYEALPLIYTGKHKRLCSDYSNTNYLERLQSVMFLQ